MIRLHYRLVVGIVISMCSITCASQPLPSLDELEKEQISNYWDFPLLDEAAQRKVLRVNVNRSATIRVTTDSVIEASYLYPFKQLQMLDLKSTWTSAFDYSQLPNLRRVDMTSLSGDDQLQALVDHPTMEEINVVFAPCLSELPEPKTARTTPLRIHIMWAPQLAEIPPSLQADHNVQVRYSTDYDSIPGALWKTSHYVQRHSGISPTTPYNYPCGLFSVGFREQDPGTPNSDLVHQYAHAGSMIFTGPFDLPEIDPARFTNLQHVVFANVVSQAALDSFLQIKSLKTVALWKTGWPNLQQICEHPGIVGLRVDRETRIPPCIAQSKLRYLTITGQTVPPEVFAIPTLEHLRLINCDVPEIPAAVGRLQSLKSLEFYECEFGEVHDSLGYLSSLEELIIERRTQRVQLPSSLDRLSSLRALKIDCHSLSTIPALHGSPNLLSYSVTVSKYDSLAGDFGPWPLIEELELACRGLDRFPDELESMPRLKWLGLSGATYTVPESLNELTSLKELSISMETVTNEKLLLEAAASLPRLRGFIYPPCQSQECLEGLNSQRKKKELPRISAEYKYSTSGAYTKFTDRYGSLEKRYLDEYSAKPTH